MDSIFPVEEEIRRFKAARADVSATQLSNASPSREALVKRFIAALEKRDTAEFRAMAISAGEFIDLYYPTSVYTKPPYRQSPELFWFLLQENSEKGFRRLLDRYGGEPVNYERHSCSAQPLVQEQNRFWNGCVVRWQPGSGSRSTLHVFGAIIERDGRFKFVSYANDL